jgi:hypothetical protein
MNPLDKIEKRIRSIFENNSSRLPWANQSELLVRQLCDATYMLLAQNQSRKQVIAPIFEVTLNPSAINRWQLQPDWELILIDVLTTASAEFGYHFQVTPRFALIPDPSLSDDEVIVHLDEISRLPLAETGVISLIDPVKSADEEPGEKIPILILQGDKTIELTRPVINIGRKNTNQIVINDLRISRNHAQIRRVNAEYIIFDVGSTGGTFINSERVIQHALRSGDVISLAGFPMIFTMEHSTTGATAKSSTSEIKNTPPPEDD